MMAQPPLQGVRVVDLSRLFPGPLATLALSDLGAEVIRVESPDGSDYTRFLPPLYPDGMGALFHTLNRGKKSITLDLKAEKDHERFLELLKNTDVLVESFRPGVLKKLGLAPADLQKQFPKLIICSLSGYGQDGLHAHKAGHDLNFMARSGILGAMKIPAALPATVADIAGGSWPSVMQICAALYARERTQKGCYIDVSMTDWTSSLMILHLIQVVGQKDQLVKPMNLLGGDYPSYAIYQALDGYLTVAALEPHFWHTFVQTLGLPHLDNAAFAENEEAKKVKAEIQNAFMQKTIAQWQTIFANLDICVEAVQPPPIPKTLQPIQLPLTKDLKHPSSKPAPRLGENNSEFGI